MRSLAGSWSGPWRHISTDHAPTRSRARWAGDRCGTVRGRPLRGRCRGGGAVDAAARITRANAIRRHPYGNRLVSRGHRPAELLPVTVTVGVADFVAFGEPASVSPSIGIAGPLHPPSDQSADTHPDTAIGGSFLLEPAGRQPAGSLHRQFHRRNQRAGVGLRGRRSLEQAEPQSHLRERRQLYRHVDGLRPRRLRLQDQTGHCPGPAEADTPADAEAAGADTRADEAAGADSRTDADTSAGADIPADEAAGADSRTDADTSAGADIPADEAAGADTPTDADTSAADCPRVAVSYLTRSAARVTSPRRRPSHSTTRRLLSYSSRDYHREGSRLTVLGHA
jgi:hypothetical protein